MRRVIAVLDLRRKYLTVFDQLNPAYAKYYLEGEARGLLESAGFVDVVLHHRHDYSWTVRGTKPASGAAASGPTAQG